MEIPVQELETNEADQNKVGFMILDGIEPSDVMEWQAINKVELSIRTVLGNRINPRLLLELSHTGKPREFGHQWQYNIFSSSFEGKKDIFLKIFSKEFRLSSETRLVRAACSLLYGSNHHTIRLYDSFGVFDPSMFFLNDAIGDEINRISPPRVQGKLASYFELDVTNNSSTGPLRELSNTFGEDLDLELPIFFDALSNWSEFQEFIHQCEIRRIEEEEVKIKIRKARTTTNLRVFLIKDKREIPLYRVPRNEQDVVLLTSMLIQYDTFPTFEFKDYETHQGIDSIVRIRLTNKEATDDDSIVEFKYRLEDFLNDIHPLSLVDVIIAWDYDEYRLNQSRYVLSKPIDGKNWLRRLESQDGSMAKVVILKYIDNLVVKTD